MRKRTEAVLLLLLCVLCAAAPGRDGATIVNSGSTNTAPYSIEVWSDGSGLAQVRGRPATPFTISSQTAARLFADLRAARENGEQLQHCMKSASFGTSTVVRWHGWTSPDLQCPPFTPAVSALAQAVTAIESAAHILPGGGLHRVPLPIEMRKIPTPTPEVQPT